MNPMQMKNPMNNQINPNMINHQIQMQKMKMANPNMNMNMNMPKMQPIMPMPMPMQMYPMSNPYLMQTLYQQDIMRQKELQQLNNNYEYQLNRQKLNEQFKVVDDKKGKK